MYTGSEFFYGVLCAHDLLCRLRRLVGEVPPLWASFLASNESLRDQGHGAPPLITIWLTLFKHASFQRSQLQGQGLSGWIRWKALWMAVRVNKKSICSNTIFFYLLPVLSRTECFTTFYWSLNCTTSTKEIILMAYMVRKVCFVATWECKFLNEKWRKKKDEPRLKST